MTIVAMNVIPCAMGIKRKPHVEARNLKKQANLVSWLYGFIGLTTNWRFLFMDKSNFYYGRLDKREYFDSILEKVCEMTLISSDKVWKCNKEECVDARYLVIAVLSEKLSDKQIAEVSGWSVQLICKARNSFHSRCKYRWGLKEMYKELLIFASCEEQ